MALPTLSDADRKKALEKAQESRRKQAAAKADISAGKLRIAEIVDTDDETVGKLRVYNILRSYPGIGVERARDIMEDLGIVESRRVRGLGTNQKAGLFDVLSEREAHLDEVKGWKKASAKADDKKKAKKAKKAKKK